MKWVFAAAMLAGIATSAFSGLAWAQTILVSAGIISDIADLRDVAGLEAVRPIEHRASRDLNLLRRSFTPTIWLGGLTFATGVLGLIMEIRRDKGVVQQSPPADVEDAAAEE